MSAGFLMPVSIVDAHQLSSVIRNRIENVLIIDSRSFIEHNACHISSAVNVCCSKIVKRRLQQDKLSVKELLMHTCHYDVDEKMDVVVYDQSSKNAESLPVDSFTVILLKKLQLTFRSVNLLTGGFEEFQKHYPDLCEDKTRKCPPLTSLSQPCLPISNQGPTRILPFLYLGSQFDAMNRDLLKDHNITYELNVSTTCPQPEFVPEGHFMRIPVNDTYSEKLLPYFPEAFNFLDKVREGSGCVLVHCLAGISRSPTVAIAYVMRYLRLSSDDGYRYVKSKRPTISPNFNFLGQLLEYEKQLRQENILDAKPEATSAPPLCSKKRLCRTDMRASKLSLDIDTSKSENANIFLQPRNGDQSPTTALARLSFDVKQVGGNKEEISQPSLPDFRQYRSKSCYGDWLRERDDCVVEKKSRECNVTTTSKVLSPVKEIKCDALISEISTGESDITMNSRGVNRQKIKSSHSGSVENFTSFSDISFKRGICSSSSEERFSIQTLSHQTSTSVSKSHEFPRHKEQQKIKMRSNQSKFVGSQNLQSEIIEKNSLGVNQLYFSKFCNKRSCNTSLERFKELSPKKEKTEPHFVFCEHTAPQYKTSSTLHPFTFNLDSHRRSDSATTSGFGSESSDCTDNFTEHGKKPDNLKLEIDIDDLEDDVILRGKGTQSISSVDNLGADRRFSPLELPDVAVSEWRESLVSPLSPSESHLLEDLEMERDIITTKTEPSSPSGSSYPSEDPDTFHDSGIPLSPTWLWPRKRVASFDTTCLSATTSSPSKDKRKYEPFNEPVLSKKEREQWFFDSNSCINAGKDTFETSTRNCSSLSDKIGLYRVQSCPGILCHMPSFWTSDGQPKRLAGKSSYFASVYTEAEQKEIMCHESCPDVLHLGDIDSSLEMLSCRQRECRRNVRMIQVS
ncbi:Dual specificity protein phosphatase 8, partial [Stegodyphus mimosarum]